MDRRGGAASSRQLRFSPPLSHCSCQRNLRVSRSILGFVETLTCCRWCATDIRSAGQLSCLAGDSTSVERINDLLRFRSGKHLGLKNAPYGIRAGGEASDDAAVHIISPLTRFFAVCELQIDFGGVDPDRNLTLWVRIASEPVLPLIKCEATVLRECPLDLDDAVSLSFPKRRMLNRSLLQLLWANPYQTVSSLDPDLNCSGTQLTTRNLHDCTSIQIQEWNHVVGLRLFRIGSRQVFISHRQDSLG